MPEIPAQVPNAVRCLAIIPARGGSKGLPGKNVEPIGGVPLVARAVRTAVSAPSVDLVAVTTDDRAIADLARVEGAVVIDRPPELAGDAASSESALLHALDHLAEDGIRPEVLAFLQCTSPFTSTDDLQGTVELVLGGTADCAFTAVRWHGFLWATDASGAATGVGHDASSRPRRQDLPERLLETGAVYAMDVEGFRSHRHRFFGTVRPFVVDRLRSLEIDDAADLAIARALAVTAPGTTVALPSALVLDFDGVLTDDRVVTDQDGREAVTSSRADGMGIEQLRSAGVRVVVLSKEANPVVAARCRKLQVECLQGIDDKATTLRSWAESERVDLAAIAYVGNDVNDLECLSIVGSSFAPSDAHPSVLATVGTVLTKPGGRGAVRELADRMLAGVSTVSVVIPVRDREDLIVRAIRSALDQTEPPLEVIVVDDGSVDRTIERVSAIDDPRVRTILLGRSSGAPVARNAGIDDARGEFVAFLDSDDAWAPEKLALQREFFGEEPAIICCGFSVVEGGSPLDVVPRVLRGGTPRDLLRLRGGPFTTSTFVARRDLLVDLRFDERLPALQDLDLVLRASRRGLPIVGPTAPLVQKFRDPSRDRVFTPANALPARMLLLEEFKEQLRTDHVAEANHWIAIASTHCQREDFDVEAFRHALDQAVRARRGPRELLLRAVGRRRPGAVLQTDRWARAVLVPDVHWLAQRARRASRQAWRR